ncbi:TRAP transporter substrate-binding protein DctP [Marinobacterium sediminicola]|uniref:C4-dicarboxylate-binding protein DctP n=1 Tax=Marinobacterium sediminicola TaxID=518898 RepID=A0ABY1RWA0_9GAMM|nr:TRAP transporter substrate-binding protein DctP [Marinobacterium sediminicola]ULG70424.1 TRAP transporter substrate-binding protein DctP [Marinobacterium sediminicola]SMR69397.1 C4-dicarboxylate-binding protein DctP [Marinobacterium sediminicola]
MQGLSSARLHMAVTFALFFFLATSAIAASQEGPRYLFRISTENTVGHVQTQAIERFARQLEESSLGRIEVRFHHSAQMFRDRDVIAALSSGKVEMAVPGMWQLDRYVPDVGLYMLPLFYGRTAEENYRLRDGKVGAIVSQRVETYLGVKVPGRWLDLGHAHLYFTDRQVSRHEDLNGLKIRIPGGVANQARLEAFGASPDVVPWPDVPNALQRDHLKGMLTTHETVRSAALWNNGIRFCFEDMEYFAQYVPIINSRFWHKLPTDLQQLVIDTWEAVVDDQRIAADIAQREARAELQAGGVSVIAPKPSELQKWRQIARQQEASTIRQMGVDPALVKMAEEAMGR